MTVSAPLDPSLPASKAARTRPVLRRLAEHVRPQVLAKDELVPLAPGLKDALDLPGLRRGSTLSVVGEAGLGATSLALALLGAASEAGRWCAIAGLADVGMLAASELGVALDRVVLVADPERRAPAVLASLIEGCDVLLLGGLPLQLSRGEMSRLAARARQRGVVLVLLGAPAAWPELPEVAVRVRSSSIVGIGEGCGRIAARRVELETHRRRGQRPVLHRVLWLPDAQGELRAEPASLGSDRTTSRPLAAVAHR